MPGPHFNSKRLKAAKNVRAEFAPGSVPRVGTSLFALRLLPRTVEKNCNCRVPKPKPPAFITKVGKIQNGNQLVDPTDAFGHNGTSWVESSGIKVGDTVSFISTQTNQLFTTTVAQISIQGTSNTKYFIILTDSHGQQGGVNVDVNLYI
jgi:hypothetical protein